MLKKINESTQVYLNGKIDKMNDNLSAITISLDNGQRNPNQIYAILRGYGISHEKACFAVNSYVKLPEERRKEFKYYYDTNNKNKVTIMNYTQESLIERIRKFKNDIKNVVNSDENRVNYSGQKVLQIAESYDIKMTNIISAVKDINEEVNEVKKEQISSRFPLALIKGNGNLLLVNQMINELYSFNTNELVAEFIGEMLEIVEQNKFKIATTYVLSSLNENKYNSKFYINAINDLIYLTNKDEKELKESIVYVLNKHKWIPEVSNLINEYANADKVLVSDNNAEINTIYSPVFINENNNSMEIALANKFYTIKNDEITECEKANGNLVNSYLAFQKFNVKNNKLVLFEGRNVLEFDSELDELYINSVEVNYKNLNEFKNYLIRTNFFHLNEMYKIDELMIMLESVDSINELDFITSINSRVHEGVQVNLIRLGDNIYINRINTAMNVNEMILAKNAENAQELVNEYISYDISNIVFEKLKEEKKKTQSLKNKKNEIVEKINFLSDKLNTVKTELALDENNELLNKAKNLLLDEIKNNEIEIQKIYNRLGEVITENKKNLDLGYVPGKLLKNIGKLKKNENIFIFASDYTTGGKSDKIKIKDSNDKDYTVEKEFLKVN